MLAAALVGAGAAAGVGRLSVRRLASAKSPTLALFLCLASHLLALVALVMAMRGIGNPTAHAHGAVSCAILGFAILHSAMGLLFAGYGLYRGKRGYLSRLRSIDLRIGSLWHDFSLIVMIVSFISSLILGLAVDREIQP